MPIKHNPRVLIAVIVVGVLITLSGAAAVGFGAAMIYTQRQTNDMIARMQSSEDRHNLEVKNARLEERATCEARISIASGSSQQMRDDITKQKNQIDSLIGSVQRLTTLTRERANKGDQISNKVDNLSRKVENATVVTPVQVLGKDRADAINKKVEEINRGSK